MSGTSLLHVTKSEWIKFRSLRSSIIGVAVTLVLTIGLGALISWAITSHWNSPGSQDIHLGFDPVRTSLAGTFFAQFAVGVIGALLITSEYSSGSIRTSLTAVPNRLKLIGAKLLVLFGTLLVVGEIASVASFEIGQNIFRGTVPTASLGTGSVARAVLLTGLALTLLGLLGFGIGLLLRQSSGSISVFVSVLLVLPIITVLLPQSWQNAVTRYEPSRLADAMRASRPLVDVNGSFSPVAATLMLTLYVAVVLVVGIVLFERRDS